VTAGVTVTTNNDKAGYSLSSAGVQAIWDALTSALTTAGSIGKRIADNLDVVLSTRLASSGYTTPPTVASIRSEMDANSSKLANLDVVLSTRLATSGYTAPPTVSAIRTEIDTNSTKLDAAMSTRLATSGYTVPPTVTAIRSEMDTSSTKLANLDTTVSSRLATSGYTTPPSASVIATTVWANATRTLSGFGTLVADVWANGTRTLTSGGGGGGATAEEVRIEMDANSTRLAAIDEAHEILVGNRKLMEDIASVVVVPKATAATKTNNFTLPGRLP
jgi:antitoxin component HigA of HigAB toxin-antitoxin module